jgi:putative endopeptidase
MDIPRPTDDFFNFVNGRWIEENPIPPEEARWGLFYELRVEVEKQLKGVLEGVAAADDSTLDGNARKARDFYRTGMDETRLNQEKDAPIAEYLQVINAVTDLDAFVRALGYLHRRGVNILWGCGVDQDLKNSDVMALYIGQGGLSLPDRDYYLSDDEKSREIRVKYFAHTERMLALAGVFDATKKPIPKKFIDLETRLARASMTRVELRDYERQYNKMTPFQLSAISPRVNWEKYFETMEVAVPEYMIVCQPEFIKEVNRMFDEISLEDLKAYARWHILNDTAKFLGDNFEKAMFDFYGRTFSGATEMKPRWRRVLGVVNGMIDEVIGRLYVKEYFSLAAKEKVTELVGHLVVAYRVRIERLDWMGPETKKKALAKLSAIRKKLGYPDKWKDYSALRIGVESYVKNYMSAHMFEFDRQMKKIGTPVDRTEWYMSPQTVNACYSPSMNEILYPAAFLQPPFFDPHGDDATNFGAIGMTIGHELTHGFDDQGSQFDDRGNMQNWWMPEDKERFNKQTEHLAEQFDAYEPLPGLRVNGKLTLGENIADLGGLLIAYDGLVHALGGPEKLTKDQARAFFIGYAISERGVAREEALRTQVQTDPHSPSIYRVNGPLSNMAEFYAAYGVAPGDKLYREESDRVDIW